MMRRRTIGCLLAVVLVAALALPAVARSNESHGRGPFSDCEAHWAKQQIAMLKAAGVLKGVGNDLFQPEGQMTRAEVSTMLLRALGLEGEAEDEEDDEPLPFDDDAQCPKWSRNHIRVCFEHRLMLGEMQGNKRFFNPNKPITRQEFVVLLVRAMDDEDERDLEALAQELMVDADELPFMDHRAIADWATGYILLALEEGWIEGYDDNTFQPNKPVTRAEAAAFMERLEAHLGWRWTGRYVGTVVSVDADSITILTEGDDDDPGEEMTFALDEDCLVYVGSTLSDLEDLEEGWEVKVFVQDELAVYIKACVPEEDEFDISGVITAIDADAGLVTVAVSSTESVVVTVTDETEIKLDGVEDPTLDDLAVGMRVEVEGIVVDEDHIASKLEAEFEEFEISGLIAAIDAEDELITVAVSDTQSVVVQLTDLTVIKLAGVEDPTFADLAVGMGVEVEGIVVDEDHIASKLEAEFEEFEIAGVISAIDSEAGLVTVAVSETESVVVTVTDETEISLEDVDDPTIADLAVGMGVEVEGSVVDEDHIASKLEAEFEEFEISGEITAVDSEAGILTVAVSETESKDVELNEETEITVDEEEDKALDDLAVGMTVDVAGRIVGTALVADEVEATSPAP